MTTEIVPRVYFESQFYGVFFFFTNPYAHSTSHPTYLPREIYYCPFAGGYPWIAFKWYARLVPADCLHNRCNIHETVFREDHPRVLQNYRVFLS